MHYSRRLLSLAALALLLPLGLAGAENEIKHRILMYDESRAMLHYVDQRDSAKDWDLQVPRSIRDFQLIGNGQFIIPQGDGYTVYELATRKIVESVKLPGVGGVMSVRRKADGTLILGANAKEGITVYEVNAAKTITRKAVFPTLKTLRMIRLTADGNVILAEVTGLTEVAFDAQSPGGGKIVKSIPLPRAKNAFMGLKKADGSYLLSGGYAHSLFAIGADGKLLREYTVATPPPGVEIHFFAGFQVLKNGNIVVCNWTGHAPQDSTKGWQLLEFAPDGQLLWHWHDAKRGGTIINIAVLDDLDENAYLDDSTGVLK